jgi:AraC family transcriptional regulator of adaptative response/methylated-DNA-[protein]-cysteine methyltransferase
LKLFSDDEARWDAVMRRDGQADGHFYYSVLTTGVYCRPSRPARTARRENVNFHATAADAERAGFRPCKRCRPTGPSVLEANAAAIERACRLIEASEKAPNLKALAAYVGKSPFHFHRIFRALMGITPKEYVAAHREKQVRTASKDTEAVAAAEPGSRGPDAPGISPKRYRKDRRDETIRFAIGECSLGSILIGSTERGICAILFGDSPYRLIRELRTCFEESELVHEKSERLIPTIVGFVESPRKGLDLPLDIRGTAFQRRVWKALREIPAGSTKTYAEIARQVGAPKATRAVTQACMSKTSRRPSRVIGWSKATERLQNIGGAPQESGHCCSVKPAPGARAESSLLLNSRNTDPAGTSLSRMTSGCTQL